MSLGAFFVAGEVGDPDVAVTIHVDPVRRDHHALADRGEQLSGVAIEFEYRINRVVLAIDGAAAGSARAAAFVGPDVAVLRIDIDAGGCSPRPAGGQLAPVAGNLRRRIR